MLLAQSKAMALCHEMLPNAKIGPAPNIGVMYPATCSPEDYLAAQNANGLRNWLYLDAAVYGTYNNLAKAWLEEKNAMPDMLEGDEDILKSGKPDYIGFNYYNTGTAQYSDGTEPLTGASSQQENDGFPGLFRGVSNPYLPKTEFGWEIDPTGFRCTMRELYSRYQLPLLVTENGLGAYDTLEEDGTVHDPYRIDYLKKHIEEIRLAISDDVEMMGYLPWSAVDLISTHEGISKRYGFIFVNRDEFDLKDMKRYRKDSFYWYQQLIKSNGTIL
jgi:6-phospho-beta-glucosidase